MTSFMFYGHVSPTDFKDMDFAETQVIAKRLAKMVDNENELRLSLAKLGAMGRVA